MTLGTLLHDATTGNWFDDAVLHAIQSKVPKGLQIAALHVSDPWVVISLVALTAFGCGVRRRWDAVALALAAPACAVLASEYVLKPMVHRSNDVVTHELGLSGTLAFPSGHETALAAVVSVLGVLLVGSGAQRVVKTAGTIGLAVVLVVAATGLVGRFFHYATDTIGAVAVAAAVTLAAASGLDAISRPRPDSPSGGHASPRRRALPLRASGAAARRRTA